MSSPTYDEQMEDLNQEDIDGLEEIEFRLSQAGTSSSQNAAPFPGESSPTQSSSPPVCKRPHILTVHRPHRIRSDSVHHLYLDPVQASPPRLSSPLPLLCRIMHLQRYPASLPTQITHFSRPLTVLSALAHHHLRILVILPASLMRMTAYRSVRALERRLVMVQMSL